MTVCAGYSQGWQSVGRTSRSEFQRFDAAGTCVVRSGLSNLSPSGEAWSRYRLNCGKPGMEVQQVEADVITPVAHKVATRREILSGREDLQ